MGKLFGTDGIRGIAGQTLTAELAFHVGQAVAAVLTEKKGSRPLVTIGKDTRISSDMLEAALMAGICSVGGDVMPLGTIPTPAVAFLTVQQRADAGIVISASHNPYAYNGIKVFNGQGYKLSDEMEEQVEDIAGIRIICQFVEDIEKVADLIQKRSDIEIKSEKDYIRHMKDSGYRSYHLIVYYTVETMNGPKRIQVEIQIRTMAMDFWATIEHSLQYKYKANIPDHIRERLSAAAKAIIVLDNEMSSVRSEIMDAQNSSQMQRNLITDILNNIENLYKVTNKREVEKIQDEFYHIYAQNDLQELKRFHKELDLIAEGYRAQAITDEL